MLSKLYRSFPAFIRRYRGSCIEQSRFSFDDRIINGNVEAFPIISYFEGDPEVDPEQVGTMINLLIDYPDATAVILFNSLYYGLVLPDRNMLFDIGLTVTSEVMREQAYVCPQLVTVGYEVTKLISDCAFQPIAKVLWDAKRNQIYYKGLWHDWRFRWHPTNADGVPLYKILLSYKSGECVINCSDRKPVVISKEVILNA